MTVELCGQTVYPPNAKALIFQAPSFKLLDILPESLLASKAPYLNKQETINTEVSSHSDGSKRLGANQRGVMRCLTRRMLRGPAVKQETCAFGKRSASSERLLPVNIMRSRQCPRLRFFTTF